MKANLFETDKFCWQQYINGYFLRQIVFRQNDNPSASQLKIETLFSSIDGKYIAFALNKNFVDYYLVVLQRRIERTNGKRKEKKNIDAFYDALSKTNNLSASLPGSFIQSYKGNITSFFTTTKDSSNLLLYVITANSVVNIWSPQHHETKSWEHLLSFALSECYISKSLCSIPSQTQTEIIFWLESCQRVTPTSDEFIRLRRVAFEYDLEGKTIKLSAPITLLDISRVSFSVGIRSLVFAGGIWLVPTFVGTCCSITVYLFSTSRTISIYLPIVQVVEENDAVISIGGNSEGVGGSHNIYVIISSYLYWVKYSESEGLQCQSFPLSDATIHGNTIQSMIVVMESTFGLIFSAVLNNGVIVMYRVILRHTPFRTTSLISLTLNGAEGDPSQDNGICIFGDNIATSCRGFAVFIQPFLIWNGFQVNRITPSSPSSWIDLDVILSVRILSET